MTPVCGRIVIIDDRAAKYSGQSVEDCAWVHPGPRAQADLDSNTALGRAGDARLSYRATMKKEGRERIRSP